MNLNDNFSLNKYKNLSEFKNTLMLVFDLSGSDTAKENKNYENDEKSVKIDELNKNFFDIPIVTKPNPISEKSKAKPRKPKKSQKTAESKIILDELMTEAGDNKVISGKGFKIVKN